MSTCVREDVAHHRQRPVREGVGERAREVGEGDRGGDGLVAVGEGGVRLHAEG